MRRQFHAGTKRPSWAEVSEDSTCLWARQGSSWKVLHGQEYSMVWKGIHTSIAALSQHECKKRHIQEIGSLEDVCAFCREPWLFNIHNLLPLFIMFSESIQNGEAENARRCPHSSRGSAFGIVWWAFLKLNVCLSRFTARKMWCWRWESLSPSWSPKKQCVVRAKKRSHKFG